MNYTTIQKKVSKYGAKPILHIQTTQELPYNEAEKIIKRFERQPAFKNLPILISSIEMTVDYIRGASPKRLRLLKYGKLQTMPKKALNLQYQGVDLS